LDIDVEFTQFVGTRRILFIILVRYQVVAIGLTLISSVARQEVTHHEMQLTLSVWVSLSRVTRQDDNHKLAQE
jgi:hypothetical protein